MLISVAITHQIPVPVYSETQRPTICTTRRARLLRRAALVLSSTSYTNTLRNRIIISVPPPQRKSPRPSFHNCLGFNVYFVTLCCEQRLPIFRNPSRCKWFLDFLQENSASKSFDVLAYCIMPDHCHFLLQGNHLTSNLLLFMKSLKIRSSRSYAQRTGQILWQHAYFEHILRKPKDIESVVWYIWLNPVRRGIVSVPQEFSFAGSFTGLQMPREWKKCNWKPAGK